LKNEDSKIISMLSQTIDLISKEKNIDPQVIIGALEDAMVAAARKFFHAEEEDLRARYSRETGTIEVYAVKRVVEEVQDEDLEISLEEALQIDESFEVNDTIEIPKDTAELGRIAAQTAKQVIYQKVREAERKNIFTEFSEKEGHLFSGVIKRFENGDVIVDIGKTEALLPQREQSRLEMFKQGERIRCVIIKVHESSKGPQVILSRTDPRLLIRLFEMEIPEIYDGTVVVKNAVREAGDRAKIAVASTDKDVDPVGACVGMKGSRINTIIRELRGEKIDIVQWSSDPVTYALNALNPAKISRVFVVDSTEPDRLLEVVVEESQLSLAIGKKGQNVRLASKLIGWNIDIKSDEEKKREVENEMRRLAIVSQSVQTLPHVHSGILNKLEEAGINTIGQLMDLTEEELMEIPGIAEKTAAKIIDSVEEIMAPVMEAEQPESTEDEAEGANGAGRRRAFLNAKDEASAKLDEMTGSAKSGQNVDESGTEEVAADRSSEAEPAVESVEGKSGSDS
jgi:transcription termination/antitermination protein NusA